MEPQRIALVTGANQGPGLVDTRASRPWFEDFSEARSPEEAVQPLLDLIFADVDPATYGELVRDGKVLPWR
jgi:hypothetical protein